MMPASQNTSAHRSGTEDNEMKSRVLILILAVMAALAASSAAFGQAEQPPPGWRTCPHCLTPEQQKNEAKFNSVGMPYNPRSLDGVWNSRPPGIGDHDASGNIIETFADIFDKQLPRDGIPPKKYSDPDTLWAETLRRYAYRR